MQTQELYQKALLLTLVTATRQPFSVQDLVALKELLTAEGADINRHFEQPDITPPENPNETGE